MAISNTRMRSDRALYWLACRLAWVVARAANRLDRAGATVVDVVLAKAALGFVSAVGWIVDRLPFDDAPDRHLPSTPFVEVRSR